MGAAAAAPITLDAFYTMHDLPESVELADGELVVTPQPNLDHSYVARALFRAIDAHVTAHQLGECLPDNVGYELPIPARPHTVRVPDVSFVQAARMPRARRLRALALAPDVAVEVRSPSDTQGVLRRKLTDYLDAGTGAVWVVDPDARTVEVHAPGAPVRVLREGDTLEGDTLEGGAALPGFTLALAALFAVLDD